MKTFIAAAATLFLAAGCATTEPTRVAQAECKIVPVTTASIAGKRDRTISPIEQRQAEAQLATSQYRLANLQSQGLAFNNVEDALRDCRR